MVFTGIVREKSRSPEKDRGVLVHKLPFPDRGIIGT